MNAVGEIMHEIKSFIFSISIYVNILFAKVYKFFIICKFKPLIN